MEKREACTQTIHDSFSSRITEWWNNLITSRSTSFEMLVLGLGMCRARREKILAAAVLIRNIIARAYAATPPPKIFSQDIHVCCRQSRSFWQWSHYTWLIIEDPIISSLFTVSPIHSHINVFSPPAMPVQEQHGRPDFSPHHG